MIDDFGDEWRYDYQNFDRLKLEENFQQYFAIFLGTLFQKLVKVLIWGVDLVWARFVAPKVGLLNCGTRSN